MYPAIPEGTNLTNRGLGNLLGGLRYDQLHDVMAGLLDRMTLDSFRIDNGVIREELAAGVQHMDRTLQHISNIVQHCQEHIDHDDHTRKNKPCTYTILPDKHPSLG